MKQLFNLIQIKKIISLVLTAVFAVMSLKGNISSEQFLTIFSMVIAFYFGQSSVRQTVNENKQ
jgi:general stress protein CsbA